MKTFKYYIIVFLSLFIALGLMGLIAINADANEGYSHKTSTEKEVLGEIQAKENNATVQRAGEARFNLVKKGDSLYRGDFVATSKKSRLWWKGLFSAYAMSGEWRPMPEMTHGSLAADSIFGFLDFQRNGASYRFLGQVPKGSVRFIKKLPITKPKTTFIIATPTAWIEVLSTDRAADFVVQSINEALTTITVTWGKVKARNISEDFSEYRILTSCQEVDIERGKEPGKVRWVSSDSMKKLLERTTIPETLPMDVPSCERVKTEVVLAPGEVFIPPPGVILFPVPIPIPDPGDDGEQEDCPCPCPEGQQFNEQTEECVPCRRGAEYNIEICECECPCPPGQILLPGQGCVNQCPDGYQVAWDLSNYEPYRCPYCQQSPPPPPRDQIPPPPEIVECGEGVECPDCQQCRKGVCVGKECPVGQYLNRETCQCERIIFEFVPPQVSATPEDVDECGSNSDCPKGQRCRNGKCVDRRPRKPQKQTQNEIPEVKFDDPIFNPQKKEKRKAPISIQGGFSIGVGIGGGGPRGAPSGGPRDVPQGGGRSLR